MCSSHYGDWHRKVHGRKRSEEYFLITCLWCKSEHRSARKEGKFCSDACKGKHYSATYSTRCKLPPDHPVMTQIAANDLAAREARRTARRSSFEWRTARECPGCACWFTPLYTPNAVCCSHRCSRRMAKRRRRAREHGARGQFTWSEFMKVAKKFDYCCAYCGARPERLDPDHVVPLSRGGSNSPANLLPACLDCNSSKNAMYLHEWAAWLSRRGLPARRTSWKLGDRRYSHLTDALLISRAA